MLGKIQKNPVKAGITLLAIISGLLITVSNTHVIKDTEVGVFVKLGKIQPIVATTGMKFTIPFIEDLRRVDTTEQKYSYEGITLATRADAASPATGNIVITYSINGQEAPAILEEFGTTARFIDTRLNQPMFSQARIMASSIEDTRKLMAADTRIELGNKLREKLDTYHTGYSIKNVMVQSIIPHSTIAKRINDAAQRAEDDVIEQANLTLAESRAATAEATATGKEKVANAQARAQAFKITSDSEANKTRIENAADAERYALEQKAIGNAALTRSLTPQILEDKRIAVEMEFAKQSKGLMPHTILNGDISTLGVPVTATK